MKADLSMVAPEFWNRKPTFPPQHIPKTPCFSILGEYFLMAATSSGTFSAFFGGAAGPLKKAPSFSPFSFVSGGYHDWSAGLPSKKSGMYTWYWWCSSSACARMSAP